MDRLTDDQIRAAFKQLTKDLMEYALESAVVQKALAKRGLLTESDLLEARAQLLQEGKEQIEKIERASRQKPPEGVQ
jgi:hypothetical protein